MNNQNLSLPAGRRALMWTGGGLAAALIIGMVAVYSYQTNQKRPQNTQHTVSDVPLDASSVPDECQYILRADSGRLAVFLPDGTKAQMVFDVPVRVLPEYDQRLLETGIPVKDYATLVRMIEDYIS